jgi:hypothetical protein
MSESANEDLLYWTLRSGRSLPGVEVRRLTVSATDIHLRRKNDARGAKEAVTQ